MKGRHLIVSLALMFFLIFSGCEGKKVEKVSEGKLIVITTLFPLYDFVKNVGKDRVSVTLLLPPGVEAHSFEPKPDDVIRVSKANVFIYIDENMEPWAEKILKGVDNKNLTVVVAGKGVEGYEFETEEEHHHSAHAHKKDPHIWLDFDKAKRMVDNIAEGLAKADPANGDFYRKNAEDYKRLLSELDERYKKTLQNCRERYIFHAGHFAFGYMAKRYNLTFVSAYPGLSADEEPTPKRIVEIVKEIKKRKARFIFYEEFISPKVAEVIKKETGAQMIKINPAHNLPKEAFDKGVSFIDVMSENLESLKVGLQCQ